MKRQSFFSTLASAVAGFAILPPATTYARIWKAQRAVNLGYATGVYEMSFIFNPRALAGKWQFLDGQTFGYKLSTQPLRFSLNPDNHKFCLTEPKS